MPNIKKTYKPLPGGSKGSKKVAVGKKPPTPVKPLPIKGSKRGK